MSFKSAMLNNNAPGYTTTWNGAISLSTSGNSLVDLFYKALRGVEYKDLEYYFNKAWEEDKLITMKLIAYIRDIKNGKGERQIGRDLLNLLSQKDRKNYEHNLKHYIATFGRFDDGIYIIDNNDLYINLIYNTLKEDLDKLDDDKSISLCAKWLPSEHSSKNKETKIYHKVAKKFKMDLKKFRKEVIVPLRHKLNLLETQMCNKEWSDIEYSKVPAIAMNIHSKPKNAFPRNDPYGFKNYQDSLKKGTTKINASILYPHQVVGKYMYCCYEDPLIEAQWLEMVKKINTLDKLSDILVLSDVSGSMNGLPLTICISLSILISCNCKNDDFKNLVLTFESKPRFCEIKGKNLLEKIDCMKKLPWGGSTDLIEAFNQLLNKAKLNKIKEENMPKKLLIISDMGFNVAQEGNNFKTNYEVIKDKYKLYGYQLPHIIFWNVNGTSKDFQCNFSENNVSLISGFSIDILKSVLSGEEITPYSTMMNAINDRRYDVIKCV